MYAFEDDKFVSHCCGGRLVRDTGNVDICAICNKHCEVVMLCEECDGRGFFYVNIHENKQCPYCEGTGVIEDY